MPEPIAARVQLVSMVSTVLLRTCNASPGQNLLFWLLMNTGTVAEKKALRFSGRAGVL